MFVLSLLNVAAFAATGLLLYRLARGSPAGQLRAALLWTCNPLLLQVLVAGGHVDSQAIVFAVAAIAVFCLGLREGAARAGPGSGSRREFAVCAAAGALAGLGAAVKLTMILVLAGLLAAAFLAAGRFLAARAGGLVAGFVVIAALALVPWGPGSLRPAWRAGSMVSIGSPWRTVRLLLRLGAGEGIADDVVKAAAVLLAVVLLVLLMRALSGGETGSAGDAGRGLRRRGWRRRPAAGLAAACAFAFTFAWLMAWPYVLPWYDSLGWALAGPAAGDVARAACAPGRGARLADAGPHDRARVRLPARARHHHAGGPGLAASRVPQRRHPPGPPGHPADPWCSC